MALNNNQRSNRNRSLLSSRDNGHSIEDSNSYNRKMRLVIVVTGIIVLVLSLVRLFFFSGRSVPFEYDGNSRIFGPAQSSLPISNTIEYQAYSFEEQRIYLETYGWSCQQTFAKSSSTNLLLERFDELPMGYATELWKYCMLYIGTANIYWDISVANPLQLPSDILETTNKHNWAIATQDGDLHHSFIRIQGPGSKVALGMIRFLLEAETLQPQALHETLALFVSNDKNKKRAKWKFLTLSCFEDTFVNIGPYTGNGPPIVLQVRSSTDRNENLFEEGVPCAAKNGEPCCQVWSGNTNDDLPLMSVQHLNFVGPATVLNDKNPLPYYFKDLENANGLTDEDLGMNAKDLPFISTVREYPTNAPPASVHETPNFFDILLRNNCLPQDKECFKCLKLGYKEGDDGGDCRLCEDKCPCYCKALCQVRPPPKRLSAEWEVTMPRYRADPSRLVPRVIHQTWFEPVTKEKYPNMSRLIESFRQSGWEYEFYDDDKAAQFLSAHFPPQVREAYDTIIPGAFKADLFRYCVLLIRGGVYADMDILLESNLDQAIDSSVGFLTAQDSPGETIGHRSCLWNGLMAASPGHPFLIQTIQNVVNNARNRFTSVDYDDMLCPNPVLAVSHTVDTLFTCGPCILGASLNDVLRRHRQTGFEFGEIDLYEVEKKKHKDSTKRISVPVDSDDMRLLIPGRSLLLRQNKEDMGSHRFTKAAENLIVAATDMPEYDDRPKSIEHYSKSHVKVGIFGLTKLYTDQKRANEEVAIRVKPEGAPEKSTVKFS